MHSGNVDEREVDRNYSGNSKRQSVKHSKKPPAFTVKHVVTVELDPELALSIGDYLLKDRCDNPAIVAFGHQLQNIGLDIYDREREEV
jgi:hypothetical protein